MGAEVVKVERPGGELNRYVRGPGFAPPPEVMGTQYVAMNRGKRGIAVDAHTDLGREVLSRLIARADVFVTNYRREALERMGLGYAQVATLNPRLVYARVSGFGPLRPRRRQGHARRRRPGPRRPRRHLRVRRTGRRCRPARRSPITPARCSWRSAS